MREYRNETNSIIVGYALRSSRLWHTSHVWLTLYNMLSQLYYAKVLLSLHEPVEAFHSDSD
jgi:hypothetical protein